VKSTLAIKQTRNLILSSLSVACLMFFILTMVHGQETEEVELPKVPTDIREQIHSKFDDPEHVHDIDLGKALCGSKLNVSIDIHNDSDNPIKLPRRTFSCGCIKGLPDALEIASKGVFSLNFKVDVGRRVEETFQNVAYWTEDGIPLLQLQFKLQSIAPLRLTSEPVLIESDEPQEVQIQLEESFSDVDLSQWKVNAYGPDVEACTPERDQDRYTIKLKLNPSVGDLRKLESALHFQLDHADGTSASFDSSIRYSNRSIVTPEVLKLVKAEEAYRCNATIVSHQLVKALKESGKLTAQLSTSKNESPLHVAVTHKIEPSSNALVQIELKLADSSKPFREGRLQLSCGEWSTEVDVTNAID
jgi:hypothetical protein